VDLDNITRTDVESILALTYSRMRPDTIIDEFRMALPYLKVGQDFFRQYHEFFQLLTKRLRRVLKSEEETYGYAQRLLGRITFLYFLQRKGWLDGDRAYLKKRVSGLDGGELFDFLYALFDKLNTESNRDKSMGNIPYLNGSLFEREPYSEEQIRKISEACAPLLRDILRAFDQYNFTISESTPLDKEVAVDPELLGSLFESMLPESERGDKGTFYTHQDEMLFMAREALRVYLTRFPKLLNPAQIFHVIYGLNLLKESRIEPKVAREVKDRLREIRVLDPAVGSGGFLMAALQALLEGRDRLNKIVGTVEPEYDAKLEIIEKNLFGVDIEREAIELARLRLWLTLVVDESVENVRPLPNLDYNLHQGDSLRISEFDKSRQTKIDVDPTVRAALIKQIATTREEYSRSHGTDKETKRQQLDATLRKLLELETGVKPPKVLPFSYRSFFADVMADGGFDTILMNPPYIEQRDIGRLPGQDRRTYKSRIIADAEELTDGKLSVDRKSDISVWFHVRSLSLLRPGGVAVVIATNKWLDVKYGWPLQAYLLRRACIQCVYDSRDRSFSADVNTVITIVENRQPDEACDTVRFVFFQIPFRQVSGETIAEIVETTYDHAPILKQSYRLVMRTQSELFMKGFEQLPFGSNSLKHNDGVSALQPSKVPAYVGTKWGNLYLRAPEVYHKVLSKGDNKLHPLGGVSRLARGVTGGAYEYFLLDAIDVDQSRGLVRCRNGLGHETLLEEQFCPPILASSEDVVSPEVEIASLKKRIFLCRHDRRELRDTYALKYIEWGEHSSDARVRIPMGKNKGKMIRVSEMGTVASRTNWYEAPETQPSRLLLPRIVKNRHVVPLSDEPVYATEHYYYVHSETLLDLWLFLNSSIFRLFMEVNGRTEGAGALDIMAYEYKQSPILAPVPSLSKRFKRFEQFKSRTAHRFVNIAKGGPIEFDQPDRRELDDLVLQEIGFEDSKERGKILSEIYDWLHMRVRERLTKPKTAPESVAKAVGKRRKEADLREFQ